MTLPDESVIDAASPNWPGPSAAPPRRLLIAEHVEAEFPRGNHAVV